MTWAPLTMRRNIAYEKLGIKREAVRLQPQISSQLRMAAARLKKRNLPASPYYYLKSSDAPEAHRVVDLYYGLRHDHRDLVPIEGYCLAAGVSPLLILGIVTATCASFARQTSALIAAASHPAVVDKTIEMALTDDGIEDRTILHKAVGFLPSPKGTQISINAAANANSSSTAQAAALAPPPEQTIRRLSDRFNEARLVAAAPTAALPEAPVVDASVVPAARFGDAPARFAVPSRIIAPSERTLDSQEEEEDERDG